MDQSNLICMHPKRPAKSGQQWQMKVALVDEGHNRPIQRVDTNCHIGVGSIWLTDRKRFAFAVGARPLNSALEIDLDFDRAVRPPPQPTEESTATLEDMIKRRIGERQFDDPETRAPPPDDLQKELAELDDKRPQKVSPVRRISDEI